MIPKVNKKREKFTEGTHTCRVGQFSPRTYKYPKYSPTTCLRWSSTVQNTISSTYLLTWLLTGESMRALTASSSEDAWAGEYKGVCCKNDEFAFIPPPGRTTPHHLVGPRHTHPPGRTAHTEPNNTATAPLPLLSRLEP